MYIISDVWQTETDTAELLVCEPCPSKVKIAIVKLKCINCPVLIEFQQKNCFRQEVRCIISVINKLINSIWIKEELPEQCKEPIIVPIYRMGDKTDCNNYRST
jgi:hypothetical protein